MVARSVTGPGKPYWKRPAGSTGGGSAEGASGRLRGAGAGIDAVGVADTDVVEATALTLFSVLEDNIAAVTAAPVAALTAAIMAIVVLDMMKSVGKRR